MRTICTVLISVLLASCAAKQPLTREEMEAKNQTRLAKLERVYIGKTQQEVLEACDKLFRLADVDYEVQYEDDSLVAKRDWFFYAVIAGARGTDVWTIKTQAVEGGTKIRAYCQSSGTSTVAHVTGGGGYSAISSAVPANIVESKRLYKLFYDRLDYLLEQSPNWVSCKALSNDEVTVSEHVEPLCLFVNDFHPSQL